jgi:hypothetical protein
VNMIRPSVTDRRDDPATADTPFGLGELLTALEELLTTRQQLVVALQCAHGSLISGAVADAPRIPAVILEAELAVLTSRQGHLLAKVVALYPPA